MNESADKSIQYIKGIGPRRAEFLAKIGINMLSDAVEYFPRAYKNRSAITPIRDLVPDNEVTVNGKIVSVRLKKIFYTRSVVTVIVEQDGAQIVFLWFNQPYMHDKFKRGMIVLASGKVTLGRDDRYVITNPDVEIIDDESGSDSLNTGRIVPIYPLTEPLTQGFMRLLVRKSLDAANRIEEVLPQSVLDQYRLVGREKAIGTLHFPQSEQELEEARKRMIFEEFFFLQMGIALRRKAIRQQEKPQKYIESKGRCENFIVSLPFTLTSAQKKVINEIESDLVQPVPMNRLLQGDVGSGKTAVAVWAMLRAASSGMQSAIMAPTEVLARQHYVKVCELLGKEGLTILMLIGATSASEKKRYRELIASGHVDIIVGTHALFQEKVQFNNLGLVVIDEQHKFGVMQRMRLYRKGFSPDMLVMTATPIPRTLSLTIYGDMDVSILNEMPIGRKPIKTKWLKNNELNKAYSFIRKQVSQKKQAYIIYPLVEESSVLELKSAKKMFNELQKKVFPDLRLGLIYGSLNPEDKERAMLDFKQNKTDMLVSTTVIEVGIDVPNATCIVIENADYFGLSQLHQLRGRVGRSSEQSYCILVGTPKTEAGKHRLKTIESTTDGFKIAEEDLYLRGTGEFFGTMQSGLPNLRIGDLFRDISIMEEAREEAIKVVSGARAITYEERSIMRAIINRKFSQRFSLVSV
jgi:ATP-dependent DNA helicase RecG